MENLLTGAADGVTNASEGLADAIAPNSPNKTAIVVLLTLAMGFGLAFLFRKKLMKPVIRYRRKRATTRRTYRRARK